MNEITKLVAKIKAMQDKAQILHKQLAAQLVLRELLHLPADADVVVSGKWVLVPRADTDQQPLKTRGQFEVTVRPTEDDPTALGSGTPRYGSARLVGSGTETHVFQYDVIPQALGGGLVEPTYDGDEPEHKQNWASL